MTASTRARRTDPETSQQAALALEAPKLRASQARVLQMFKLYGDLHDKALITYLHDAERSAGMKPMSPSGVRSRRSELSKPNMDRLDEIVVSLAAAENIKPTDDVFRQIDWMPRARQQLRREGFRSPLWDTGRREVVDGRNVIIWGLAR